MVNVKNIADEADMIINERYKIDELADAAGGYFAMPSADELAYTELLFDSATNLESITILPIRKRAHLLKK